MGYQGHIIRIVFVVIVAVGFSYRNQIMDIISKTVGKSSRHATTVPHKPLQTPEPDYYNPPFDSDNPPEPTFSKSGVRLITKNELAAHGHSGPLKPIWLAVMGNVFDVDKGAEHYYGPNGGYKFFSGS